MKDQWDCVLNDLEELGDKEFLVLMDQYNIEIFSCFPSLLPLYSSTFHQTKVEIVQNRSEDNPLISRIQSLHLLLEVDHHDDEEYSVVLTLGTWRIIFWLNISSRSFTDRYSFCRWVGRSTSSWFCFSLWSDSQKQVHSFSTQNLQTASQRFPARCCRPPCWSYVRDQLVQAMRNSENCLCLQIQF